MERGHLIKQVERSGGHEGMCFVNARAVWLLQLQSSNAFDLVSDCAGCWRRKQAS